MSVRDLIQEIEALWPNYNDVGNPCYPIKVFVGTITAMAKFPDGHPNENWNDVYSIIELTEGQVLNLREQMSLLKVLYPPEKWPYKKA